MAKVSLQFKIFCMKYPKKCVLSLCIILLKLTCSLLNLIKCNCFVFIVSCTVSYDCVPQARKDKYLKHACTLVIATLII